MRPGNSGHGKSGFYCKCNELSLNFTKTDDLHFGPHHKKFYIKDEHDMTELHGIIPNFILNEPWDTLEDLEKGINTT